MKIWLKAFFAGEKRNRVAKTGETFVNGVKLYQTPEVFLPSDVRGYYFCPPGIFLFKDFIPFLLKGKVRICLSQLDGSQISSFTRRFKF